MRSEAAADRLLEESWDGRTRRLPRRELVTEIVVRAAVPRGGGRPAPAPRRHERIRSGDGGASSSASTRSSPGVEFPVGAGNVLPTQLVLIPMLVLAPPGAVPFLVAAGLLLARLSDWIRGRGSFERLLFSIPDAWHAVGPALRAAAGRRPASSAWASSRCSRPRSSAAACSTPARAMLRERASRGVAPTLQLHVFGLVWAVDACLAPIGFLAAVAAQRNIFAILLVLPLAGLLLLMAGDRRKRIEQAQHRLEIAVRERSRLQAAVRRMGDAFAAKLDIDALVDIMLRGSIEALDADAGRPAARRREPRLLAGGLGGSTSTSRSAPRATRRARPACRSRSSTTPDGRSRCRSPSTGRRRPTARSASLAARARSSPTRSSCSASSSARRRPQRPTSSATTRCARRRSATR